MRSQQKADERNQERKKKIDKTANYLTIFFKIHHLTITLLSLFILRISKVFQSVTDKCFSAIDKHATHVLESDELEAGMNIYQYWNLNWI